MTTHRPLVIDNGRIAELPVGHTIVGAAGTVTGAAIYAEPVVVAGSPTPNFVTTSEGDIVTAGVY